MPLSMERWVGKVAVVTGGAGGIGAAITEQLVEAGLEVVGLDMQKEKLEELAQTLINKKGKVYTLKCDVSDEKDIIEAFNWAENNVGPIQILVNNAGIIQNTNLLEGDTTKWKKVFDVNLWGTSICTREAIKRIREHNIEGHIVNINSLSGHKIIYYSIANVYPASKYAQKALIATFRKELQLHKINNIKLTCISPGGVATEITKAIKKEKEPIMSKASPMLKPTDIADSVLYVLSTPQRVEVM